jgi:Cytochrome C'
MSNRARKWAFLSLLALGVVVLSVTSSYSADDDDDKKAVKAAADDVIKLVDTKGDVSKEAEALAKKHEIDKVMHGFKPRLRGGIGIGAVPGAVMPDSIELKIIDLGKQKVPAIKKELAMKSADLQKMAEITRAIAEINEFYAPTPAGKKNPKLYKKFNDDMKKTSKDLIEAIKMADAEKVKAAATSLTKSCNECHSEFRNEP